MKVKTPSLPEAGNYTLYIHYLIGQYLQPDQDWKIICGDKTYFIDDPIWDVRPIWLWKGVECNFDKGVNYFYLESAGWNEVGVEEFKIAGGC